MSIKTFMVTNHFNCLLLFLNCCKLLVAIIITICLLTSTLLNSAVMNSETVLSYHCNYGVGGFGCDEECCN